MKTLIITYLSLFFNLNLYWGGHQLTSNEAEIILGEACQQTEKTTTANNGGHKFRSTFKANANDKVALYFVFESFKSVSEADKSFEEMKLGNQSLEGFEQISNLGDEAFYHSDGQNFSLIIVRKNNEMIRIKVNKITAKTSVAELKKVAADIVARV